MANQVQFDYLQWVATFPEFACVNEQTAQGYFDLSTVYLRNDGCSVVPTDALQLTLLNLLTAHVAKLLAPTTAGAPSGLVGRISNATEGSVSVGADFPGVTASSAWFMQTQYGAMFWQSTAPFRTMRYVPGPQPFLNGPFQGGAWYNRRGTGARPVIGTGCCWPL